MPFAEVGLKFEWEIDKVGAAAGVHKYLDSSQTKYVALGFCEMLLLKPLHTFLLLKSPLKILLDPLMLPCFTFQFSHVVCSGYIPSETFLVPLPTSAPLASTAMFQRNDPQWICTRDDFDQSNQRRNLANRVWRLYEGQSSAREELCDFNLLVYAASLGVDLKEVQALTEELVKPVFNEEVVRVLLGSESWLTFVSTNMS